MIENIVPQPNVRPAQMQATCCVELAPLVCLDKPVIIPVELHFLSPALSMG